MPFRHIFFFFLLVIPFFSFAEVTEKGLCLWFASDREKMEKHLERGQELLEKGKMKRSSRRFRKSLELAKKLKAKDPDYYLFPLLMKIKGRWDGGEIPAGGIEEAFHLLRYKHAFGTLSYRDSSSAYLKYYEKVKDTFDLHLSDLLILTYYGCQQYEVFDAEHPETMLYMLQSGLNTYQPEKSKLKREDVYDYLFDLSVQLYSSSGEEFKMKFSCRMLTETQKAGSKNWDEFMDEKCR